MKWLRKLIREEMQPDVDNMNKYIQDYQKRWKEDENAWRQGYQERANDFQMKMEKWMEAMTAQHDHTKAPDVFTEIRDAIRGLKA